MENESVKKSVKKTIKELRAELAAIEGPYRNAERAKDQCCSASNLARYQRLDDERFEAWDALRRAGGRP